MISYISGKVVKLLPNGAIVDVNGVGYELSMPLSTIGNLQVGLSDVSDFWVYTRVREDAISLFGFVSWEDRQTFALLVQISGVGPKVAIAMLSTLSVADLVDAVDDEDPGVLVRVPGIGRRTAEKILLELKGKRDRLPLGRCMQLSQSKPMNGADSLELEEVGLIPTWTRMLKSDVVSALENLGFKDRDVMPVVRELEKNYSGEDFSELVKKALKSMSSERVVSRPAAKASSKLGQQKSSLNDLDQIF